VKRALVAATVALAACGGNAAPGGAAPKHHRTGTAATPLVYAPAPPTRYVYYRRDSIVTLLPNGAEVPQVLGRTLMLTVSITPPAPGTPGANRLTISIDSVAVDSDAPAMARPAFQGIAGTTWTADLAPNGRLTGFSADRHSAGADQAAEDLLRLLPTLPAGGAVQGTAWTDTVTADFPIQSLQVSESLFTKSSAMPGLIDGQLDMRSDAVVTRSGSNGQLVLSGGGIRSSVATFGADGRLVSETGSDSIAMKVSVKAVGQAVSLRQLGRFTVTARP
jgi:hypothetical protein